MQSLYSLSCISPSLCKLFVSFKSKKLAFVKKKKKRRPAATGACVLEAWDAGESPHVGEEGGDISPPGSCLQLPRLSQASPPRSSISYVTGRHSDATPAFPRFSTSSSSCYERLSVEYSQEEGQGLPRHVKLGMVSDRPFALTCQDSSTRVAQQRDSSCSAASFVSSTSSRLRGMYAQQMEFSRKQPHIGELFASNQFLTPLTAAPAVLGSPCEHAFLQPSSGLVDAGLRCRDADLKDRIILFL